MQMFLQQLMALFLPTKDNVGLFAATLWKVLSEALWPFLVPDNDY